MKIRLRTRERSLGQLLSDYIIPYFLTRLIFVYRSLVPKRQESNDIILFSHRFDGNVKAFYDYAKKIKNNPFNFYYLADEFKYYKTLIRQKPGIDVLSPLNIKHLLKVADSGVFISTHGPIIFSIFFKLPRRPVFIDVWHGVGHKKHTSENFKLIHPYDAVFASSVFFKSFYKKWGFDDSQIKVTGYARTDPLVKKSLNRKSILEKFAIKDTYKKIILFAPTFTHGKDMRSVFPFGIDEDAFLKALNQLGEKENSLVIIRPHLNTDLPPPPPNLKHIKFLPFSDFPETTKLLYITDVLITDWSSVFAEFSILNRPIIFLDTPPTFQGYTLTPADRPGYLANGLDSLIKYVETAIKQPEDYQKQFGILRKQVLKKCFGDTLDGKSSERYLKEIKKLLSK